MQIRGLEVRFCDLIASFASLDGLFPSQSSYCLSLETTARARASSSWRTTKRVFRRLRCSILSSSGDKKRVFSGRKKGFLKGIKGRILSDEGSEPPVSLRPRFRPCDDAAAASILSPQVPSPLPIPANLSLLLQSNPTPSSPCIFNTFRSSFL